MAQGVLRREHVHDAASDGQWRAGGAPPVSARPPGSGRAGRRGRHCRLVAGRSPGERPPGSRERGQAGRRGQGAVRYGRRRGGGPGVDRGAGRRPAICDQQRPKVWPSGCGRVLNVGYVEDTTPDNPSTTYEKPFVGYMEDTLQRTPDSRQSGWASGLRTSRCLGRP